MHKFEDVQPPEYNKTGKLKLTNVDPVVTKKTDFVSSLGKSLTQTGEINKKQLNNLLSELAAEIDPDGCGRKTGATGGRIGFKFGSTVCATKAKNYLNQVVDRGIQNEPSARVGLIKK